MARTDMGGYNMGNFRKGKGDDENGRYINIFGHKFCIPKGLRKIKPKSKK